MSQQNKPLFPGWKPFVLHVEVLAPTGPVAKQDQSFWMFADNPKTYYQIYPDEPHLYFTGTKPGFNPVESPFSTKEKTYYAPILLHYEPHTFRLTAYENFAKQELKTGKVLWKREILCALPESLFPPAKLSPSWSPLGGGLLALLKSPDEIANEIAVTDPSWKIKVMEFSNVREEDKGVSIRLEINKLILKGSNNQPISYGIDRVYSLDAFGVILDATKLKFN